MAVRTRTVWKLKRGIYEAWEGGEAEVTTGDTVTVDSLSGTAAALYRVAFWKMTDGTVVNVTHTDLSPNENRITIGHSGGVDVTNCKCIYMVYGVKA
jgi:hypothetical protein